jgi:hypothetical protein
MNERIQALAESAEIKFEAHPQHSGIVTAVITPADLERFAELIVRECTELTLDHKNDDYYAGWLDYRDEIRRHFGVGE